MAHLGNVGTLAHSALKRSKVAPLAVLKDNTRSNPSTSYPVNGSISGTASIAGVGTAGILVRLYYRPSGLLIEQAVTGAGGTYSFTGLDPSDAGAYYVTFHDPNTSAPYNFTVTKDHLTAG